MERTTRRRLMLSPSRAGPCSVAAHNVRAACAKHGAAQQLDRGPPRRCQRHARSNTWSRPDTPRQQPAPKWGIGLRKVARGTAAHRRSRSELSLDTRGWSRSPRQTITPKPLVRTLRRNTRTTPFAGHEGQCGAMTFEKDPEMTAVDWTPKPCGSATPRWHGCAGRRCRGQLSARGAGRGTHKPHTCLDSMGWPCSSCWSRFIQRGEEQFLCQQLQRRGDRDRYERADNPQQRRPDQDGDHGDAARHFYGASNDLGHQ